MKHVSNEERKLIGIDLVKPFEEKCACHGVIGMAKLCEGGHINCNRRKW